MVPPVTHLQLQRAPVPRLVMLCAAPTLFPDLHVRDQAVQVPAEIERDVPTCQHVLQPMTHHPSSPRAGARTAMSGWPGADTTVMSGKCPTAMV